MKKIIAIFATVALATAFVGCGGSAPVDDGGPDDGGEEVGADPGEGDTLEGGDGGGEGEGEE